MKSCAMKTELLDAERRTDTTTITVAFHKSTNAPCPVELLSNGALASKQLPSIIAKY
jgi:hypothetical protein